MASCGGSIVKIILFVFNLLWLILGGVVIWLGVTITNWSGDVGHVLDNNMKGGSVAVIVAGALIFLVAFLGCCGACKENSCMLSTYGGIILILVIIQCVGVYFAFRYKTDVDEKIKDGIKKELNLFLDKNNENAARIIQGIQSTFHCCGVDGSSDYTSRGKTPLASCCDESWNDEPLKTCSAAGTAKAIFFSTGCGDKVKDTLNKYLGGTAGVAIALVLIQLLIVVMACCLSREVRN